MRTAFEQGIDSLEALRSHISDFQELRLVQLGKQARFCVVNAQADARWDVADS